jgi:hypothetical protein
LHFGNYPNLTCFVLQPVFFSLNAIIRARTTLDYEPSTSRRFYRKPPAPTERRPRRRLAKGRRGLVLPGLIGEARHRCTPSRQRGSIPCGNMAPKSIHLRRKSGRVQHRQTCARGKRTEGRRRRGSPAVEQRSTWIYPSHCHWRAFIYFSSAQTSIDGMAGGVDQPTRGGMGGGDAGYGKGADGWRQGMRRQAPWVESHGGGTRPSKLNGWPRMDKE